MKSQTKALVVGSMTALVGILSPVTVFATGTCYEVIGATDDIKVNFIRYIAKSEGSLNTDWEVKNFDHLYQTAYRLIGKATFLEPVCAPGITCPQERIMTAVVGTIITGKQVKGYPLSSYDAPGAHMGLDVHFLRIDDGDAKGPIIFECTSTEARTTPNQWTCIVKGEESEPQPADPSETQEAPFDDAAVVADFIQPITLQKRNPQQNPACSVFQDSGGALPIPTTTTTTSSTTTATTPPM